MFNFPYPAGMARRNRRNKNRQKKWFKICAMRNSHVRTIHKQPEHVPNKLLPRNYKWTRTEPHISYRPRNLLHIFYEGASRNRLSKFIHDAIRSPSQWTRPAQRETIERMMQWRVESAEALGLVSNVQAEEMNVNVGKDVFIDSLAEWAVRSPGQDTFCDRTREHQFVEELSIRIRKEPRRRWTRRKVVIKKNKNIEVPVLLRPFFVTRYVKL